MLTYRSLLFSILVTFCGLTASAQIDGVDELIDRANYYKTQDLDSLNRVTDQLLEIANRTGDDIVAQLAIVKKVEGLLAFNYNDEADSLFNKLSVQESASKLWVDYLLNKGKLLRLEKQNSESLEALYDALTVAKKLNYNVVIPDIYIEIAILLRENQDLENTRKYLLIALEEARNQGLTYLEVKACIRMCMVYNGWIVLDLDSSVYYGQKAVSIAQEAKDEFSYANAISIVPAPFIRNGQVRKGLELSKKALTLADRYNFTTLTRYYLIGNLGFAYKALENYDSALFYQEKAVALRPNSLDITRLKYEILKDKGDYRQALEAHEIYTNRLDSTLRERNKTSLSSLQARLEANQKEQEVEALKQEAEVHNLQLRQQRALMVGLIMILIFIAGGGVMMYRQRQLKQRQELTAIELAETHKRLELEQQYRASELKAIRSQMNPHFVFNALNSIQEYIMSNERKLAGMYLGKFADLMRIYLEHSQVKLVSVREELEALELYLELEKLRFEESFDYQISIGEEVDVETMIPSLLLQPYVENAIKHGLLHKEHDRKLDVNLAYQSPDASLICAIADNGVGRTRSQEINQMRNPGHKSFATSATKSRLELLNHDRQRPIVESIEDLVDDEGKALGTRVTLTIPI